MSVALAADIWNLIRDVVPFDEKSKVADGLVSILIDHGYESGDIAYEFTDDTDVIESLSYYVDGDSGYEQDDGGEDW